MSRLVDAAVADPVLEPAGTPHTWQNRAPADSVAPHEAHADPPSDAPQAEQKRPLPCAPQLAQVAAFGEGALEGDVMADNVAAGDTPVQA